VACSAVRSIVSPPRKVATYASKSHVDRNFCDAVRPWSNNVSCEDVLRSKSVAFTCPVSTNIVRASTDGSSMCIWSWKFVIVPTIARASPRVPLTSKRCSTGAAGFAESLIPNVGHLGGLPSVRSNTSIGKFESMPPSTMNDRIGLPASSRPSNFSGS
jgi:hypothetical protein